jgi:MFS family permease
VSRSRRARGLFLDISPLRLDHDYRLMWSGQVVAGIGSQITRLALPFQVWILTQSTLAIAALTAVQLVPILVFVVGAGSIVDVVDKRRLLLIAQVGLAFCSLAFVGLALLPSPPLIAILAIAFIAATLGSFGQPASSSSTPRLVPSERLPAAIALNQLNFQAASVIGPAFGGVLIAVAGLPVAYAVDVLTFGASIFAIWRIAPLPPLGGAMRPGLAAIREGLRFAVDRRVILATFVIDLDAMIFGMPTSLFPVLALEVFRVGPAGLGLLAAAPAIGAFLGALLSGWVSVVRHVGRAVVIAVLIWGAAITAFGLSTFFFPLALLFLAIAGAADVISAVFRSTVVQLATPDALRGRVTALHILAVSSGPRIGDIEAAAVAAVVGAQASVVSGGILCLIGAVAVTRLFPELRAHVVESPAATQRSGDDAPA